MAVPPKKRQKNPPWEDGHPRNQVIAEIAAQGVKAWKNASGYHQRSLAENGMYRLKQLFGNHKTSQLFESQVTEVHYAYCCHEYHDLSWNACFRSARDSCALSFSGVGNFGLAFIYAPTPYLFALYVILLDGLFELPTFFYKDHLGNL